MSLGPRWFHALVEKAGLQSGPWQRVASPPWAAPQAVRALETSPRELPASDRLAICWPSTYLGHAHVADTYWYLQVTPQLLTQMISDWERLLER